MSNPVKISGVDKQDYLNRIVGGDLWGKRLERCHINPHLE